MPTDDRMRHAEVANGESPDEIDRQPEDGTANGDDKRPSRPPNPETESVPTGERQAEENREAEPPA